MSRLDFWRRLFHHSALGLASACLLYAEAFFLPEPLLVGLYVLACVQVLGFVAEGRRWVLPSWAANLLAGAVAGGGVAWIASELNRPDSVLAELPLPAGLLPYIGPILIGLLVIKLFRPQTPRDFWLLQGVGALQVALACVLATNPESGFLFGGLLAAYLGCVLGRLALHYFEEEQRLILPPVGQTVSTAERMPFAYLMTPFCLRWLVAIVGVATPLFLLTPRVPGPPWDSSLMAASQRRGGMTGEHTEFVQQIDLNRDGPVRLTDEEIFRVAVEGAPDQPVPTLPADQYWRGGVLDSYRHGRWTNQEMKSQSFADENPSPRAPETGPGSYRLDFTVGPRAGGFFLAEPVSVGFGPGRSTSVDVFRAPNRVPIVVSTRGPVLPHLDGGQHDCRYRQTINSNNDAERTPTYDLRPYISELRRLKMPQLTKWTSALLTRLAAKRAYGLSPNDIQLVSRTSDDVASIPLESYERVGLALTDYLRSSGKYTYTLDLQRQDSSLDPVMDFLVNTKKGHCERFASALALMLRSQGVPSRIVVGFHGAANPTNGVYVIRAKQAHAWVQMWTPGPPRAWVTLDPTPAVESTAPVAYSLWELLQDSQRAGQEWWGGYVVNYSADEQTDLWMRLHSPSSVFGATTLKAVALISSCLAVVGGLTWIALSWRRKRLRRESATAPAAAGYSRLLALLARHARLRLKTGQTPREFAAEARRFLMALPAAHFFADLPDVIVDRLYWVRYGGRTLTSGDNAAVVLRLNQLAAALKRS